MDDLGRIQSRIESLRGEISELEIAARVLRGLRSGANNGASHPARVRRSIRRPRPRPAGKLTIADFARDVLRDSDNGGMHFREVADQAVKLGFRGRKGSGAKTIQQSFWATMKRSPTVFDALGGGKFKLK